MTASKTERSEEYDIDLFKRYLQDFPTPSIGSMNIFCKECDLREDWEGFLAEKWDYKLKIMRRCMPAGNVVIDGLPVVPIRNLFVEHSKQAIELETCEVVSISKVEPYAEYVRFKCIECGEDWTFPRELAVARPKKKCCSDQNIIQINDLESDAVDSQIVRLQEIQYDGASVPVVINAILKGKDMVWSIKFNERVRPIGMLRHKRMQNPKTHETEYQSYFEIYGVKKVDPDADNSLTEQEIKYIQSEQAKPDFYNKFIRSFAPNIWGMHSFKEAIILALASIKLPRPARILIVTDPGMGKSRLIKTMKLYYPQAILTQMGRSTKTGLTVSSERDEETGRRHIGRGALAQAHNGIVVMDEIQFGEEKDFMILNDVMESGQIKYAFPGGNVGYIDANCAIIMLSNPHQGKFGFNQSIGEILKFMGKDLSQQMSRIQYTLLRRDKLTTEERRKIAEHMAKHNENNPLYMDRYYENWYDEQDIEETAIEILPGLIGVFSMPAERFGTKWIKKILKYVINYVQVSEMPQQHMRTLVDYYMKNRTDIDTETNKMITNRFMEHGINLATYMARLKGLPCPTETEILHTMELLEKSMSVAAFDPKTGKIDTNPFNNSRSEQEIDEMSKEEQFLDAIKKAMADDEGKKRNYFTIDDLLFYCNLMPNSKWKNDIAIEKELAKWLRYGKVEERHGEGKYTLV